MSSGLDKLLDQADWRCTVCGAQAGSCGCWKKCWCGWSYRVGEACGNDHDAHLANNVTCVCSRPFASGRECADARGNKSRCACVCHRKGVRAAYEKKGGLA